jgi:hypothetical protein
MKLTRLNYDSSWLWELNDLKILVDPWFSPSQVDFFPWFSEQFHVTPQPQISEFPKPDLIFISNPFTDHCNKETLLSLADDIPLYANNRVLKKVSKWNHFKTLLSIEAAPIKIEEIQPTSFLDLVHSAFLISSDKGNLLYAPHGCKFQNLPKAHIFLTTLTTFHLPFWLGGTVNLGEAMALENFKKCEAEWLLSTHDEQKRGKGLIEKIAKKTYASPSQNPRIKSLKMGESFLI